MLKRLALPVALLVALTSSIAWGVMSQTRSSDAASSIASAEGASARPARAARVAVRAAQMAEVDRLVRREVDPMPDGDDAAVAAYLSKLAARARSKGRVTVAEVEPGIVAIRRSARGRSIGQTTALIDKFMDRMTTLSARLEGRAPPR